MNVTQSASNQPKKVPGSPGRSLVLARARISRNLSRPLLYYLSPGEVHSLMSAVEDDRGRLLLTVLWETGTKISEAIAIRLRDVGRDGIRVLGKGQNERVVFVLDSLVSSILLYAHEQGMARDDFLFSSRKGGHITKQRADQIIKRAGKHANLERTVYAHLFRHGYAINSLNCGGRLDALQEQLGHRDINTPLASISGSPTRM